MSERCKFFIPGPTWVRPAILQEMTRPMIGHRSAEFRELFGGIRRDLKTLFETSGDTLVITASGTGVMQAALENCVNRRVLVTTCGAFSERWLAIAQSLGYEVDRLDAAPQLAPRFETIFAGDDELRVGEQSPRGRQHLSHALQRVSRSRAKLRLQIFRLLLELFDVRARWKLLALIHDAPLDGPLSACRAERGAMWTAELSR